MANRNDSVPADPKGRKAPKAVPLPPPAQQAKRKPQEAPQVAPGEDKAAKIKADMEKAAKPLTAKEKAAKEKADKQEAARKAAADKAAKEQAYRDMEHGAWKTMQGKAAVKQQVSRSSVKLTDSQVFSAWAVIMAVVGADGTFTVHEAADGEHQDKAAVFFSPFPTTGKGKDKAVPVWGTNGKAAVMPKGAELLQLYSDWLPAAQQAVILADLSIRVPEGMTVQMTPPAPTADELLRAGKAEELTPKQLREMTKEFLKAAEAKEQAAKPTKSRKSA